MVMLKICYVLILALIPDQVVRALCPAAAHIKPCNCKDNVMICHEASGVRLKEMFTYLHNHLEWRQRHIHRIEIYGSHIVQLPEHMFNDIIIDEIVIKNTPKLKTMSEAAFKGTEFYTKRLVFNGCPQLDVSNLFTIVNRFRALTSAKICNLPALHKIPDEAFAARRKLKELLFCGHGITSIGLRAFYKLSSLSRLDFMDTHIAKIPGDVFTFEHDSKHVLTIGLINNRHLNGLSFTPATFAHTKRPTNIDFSGYHFTEVYRKQITFLAEEVFRPYFKAHASNDVNLYGLEFNCISCKNKWLKTLENAQN
ncbi:unnamed protein product, partial [Medioppia subpectinata]